MKRLLLVFAACALGWATGCSSGGSSSPVTPPASGFNNASLTGAYVFSLSGTTLDNTSGTSAFSRVGVFSADGKGDILTTGGLEDVHMFGAQNIFGITGGSYSINSDGRGSLCIETSGGMVQYSISLVASSSGYMADMGTVTSCSSGGTLTNTETASGSFTLQTATSLATGTYTFDFSGISPISGNAISRIGDFIPSAAASGSFSSGSFEDVNDGGNFTTKADITGSYQPDNNSPGTGRGTAIINGLNYVYYVIDGQHAQFMETDPDQVIAGTNAGEAVAQQIGTPNNTSAFNSSSFVFVMGGSDSSLSPFTRGARFTATGGSVAGILLDENDAGSSQSVPKSGVLSGGTITLDGDNSGRGTLTFTDTVNNTGTYSFVFYLNSATQGVIQDVTTVLVGGIATPVDVMDGSLLAQTGAPFTSSGLAKAYAFDWSGATANGEEDFVGSFTPANTAPNGLVDYNEFGVGKLFLNTPFNGVFTIGGDGTSSTGQHSTFVAGLSGTPAVTINYFAYIANPSTILIMGTQNNGARVIAGVLTAQTP